MHCNIWLLLLFLYVYCILIYDFSSCPRRCNVPKIICQEQWVSSHTCSVYVYAHNTLGPCMQVYSHPWSLHASLFYVRNTPSPCHELCLQSRPFFESIFSTLSSTYYFSNTVRLFILAYCDLQNKCESLRRSSSSKLAQISRWKSLKILVHFASRSTLCLNYGRFSYVHIHTHIYIHTYQYTHTHAHAHSHTQTHTHTYIYLKFLLNDPVTDE